MVILENRDKIIFDFHNRVVDILKEYQDTGSVIITTNLEGICLRSAGVYDCLDYICEQFNISKSAITIHTPNAEEFHDQYRIDILGNHWIKFAQEKLNIIDVFKDIKFTVGSFNGRPNWHRVVLSTWLNKHYPSQTLQTLHFQPGDEILTNDLDLSEVFFNVPNEMADVVDFLKKCPITLAEGFIYPTIGADKHYNILPYYNQIFLDLVNETYVSGLTFFPTEKTLRPIIALTPFIIMGPMGYLENLRRMGLKTFSQWWDESYDNYQGYDRVQKIQAILREIFSWDNKKLIEVNNEMNDVLRYNKNLLSSVWNTATTKLS